MAVSGDVLSAMTDVKRGRWGENACGGMGEMGILRAQLGIEPWCDG